MNSNFGLIAPLTEYVRDKGERRTAVVDRAGRDFALWMATHGIASSMQDSTAVDETPEFAPAVEHE
jgi:hypothetical protein